MKCNIDLHQSNGYGGIPNYIRNISSRLINTDRIQFEGCSFWYRKRDNAHFKWFPGRLHKSFYPDKYAFSRSNIKFPIPYERLMCSSADLNIFFSYRLPCVKINSPVVSTIHDIILLKTNCESKDVVQKHRSILNDTVKRSSYLLTVSEASKKDIVDYFEYDPDKIFIVHNGIDQCSFGADLTAVERQLIKDKYGLPDKFILNFGQYRRHKNIERLIEAYASLPIEIRKDMKLVFTTSHPSIESQVSLFGLEDDVKYIGFVPENEKVAIYKMATMVYYASLYEGFGVPVIEAQAAGVPVITSSTSSLPEAAGGGAVLVDPYNVENITSAIERLYSDKLYASELIERGLANSRQYTWKQSIEEFKYFLDTIS